MQEGNNIFALEPPKWDEARLQSYITDKIEESLTLDYKDPRALAADKVSDITKDVSSFLNSAGGIIIYGLCEFSDKSKQHLAEKISPVNRLDFSKERLESIIARIQPRPFVIIHPVPLSSGPNDVAYVVEIPQSKMAHQATDLRYYKRYNFESVPMQDFEIRDVNRRKAFPIITTEVHIQLGKNHFKNNVIWHVRNEGDVMARWVYSTVDVPLKIQGGDVKFEHGKMRRDEEGFSSWRLQPSNAASVPLFPKSELLLHFDFSFVQVLRIEGMPPVWRDVIKVRTFADDMPPQDAEFKVAEVTRRSPFN